ncbi:YcjX family protein [Rhodosalinus sp. K401]|uniref:YcjX family protein n=1 Tax=Rhodosalinus sp. K401 TaxID=3239195 RepID=UPI003523F029
MVIGTLADGLARGVESVGDRISETFFEPVIRLGVTGLSRAGKTVFITSLVANLIERGRMSGLAAAAEGRMEAAYLQPQPDDTVPRFDYETHLAALTAAAPHWPESTRSVSELRLSFRVRPTGLLGGLAGPRIVHLDIVDYPGEWLLDLTLMERSYREWSEETLARLDARPGGGDYLRAAAAASGRADWEEPEAKTLAEAYTAYLAQARAAGFSDLSPGRFLMPGDLAGSPALTFAPLPPEASPPRRGLWREMERRYDAYKRAVVRPFFREHFARIDRQVVLVDVLGAIHAGPRAVEDLRRTMADILSAFRPGRNDFLSQILRGKRVEKILFAATKADHLHHRQHPRLTAIIEAMMREARERAHFAGAETSALSIAALRATTEEMVTHEGEELPCVRGRVLETGRQAAFYPGALPENPSELLAPAREGRETWLEADFSNMRFAPAPLTLKPGDGPPHIRLDRAAQILFGDRL